jgi:ATP-dependent Clp protease protease subunit
MYQTANVVLESVRGFDAIPIDDIFLRERKIFLVGSVTDESCNDLIKKLLYLESVDNSKPVTVFLNSPGGSVWDGLSVYDTIRLMKSPVTAVVTGIAASMGSVLLLACEKENRLMLPSSRIMIHDCSWGKRDFGGVKPGVIQEELDMLKKTNERLLSIIAERTGHKVDEISEITKEDAWFDAGEAIEFGLASAVIDETNFETLIRKETV